MWWQNRLAILATVLGLVIIGNLIFVDYQILTKKETQETPQAKELPQRTIQPLTIATPSTSCLADCQAAIEAKIAQLKEQLLKTLQTPTPKPQTKPTAQQQTQTQPKEIYINFGNGGTTTATSWTDISGTDMNFDAVNYGGAKAFYFQGNLKSDATDRQTYARIYDVTHSVGVQGAEMNYAGLVSKLTESGSLTFLSGRLTLRVQIHSLNGNLATIENPKIRIVY